MRSNHKSQGTPADSDANGYAVGYAKPPENTRFQPGRSGNPAGRRKGLRNLRTDVKLALTAAVKIKKSGRAREISTQEASLMLLREKMLKGDARAGERLLDLARQFNNEPGEAGPGPALCSDDEAILACYAAEITAAAEQSAAPSSGDQATLPDEKGPE
jgi:hypothetical protein